MAEAAELVGPKGPLQIGEQFLKFEIRGLLGHGGHGWVYHGYDSFLDRHVAIKVIPNPADRGRDLQRRAQLEARVLCKLQHPNVVRVIDAGASSAGAVYIVMEILHGRTLREVLHALGPLNVYEMLSLGAQIADGVHAAHEQSAIHRDLKPENVFVLESNAVKVLDFGIAKFLGPGAATTQKDLLHGTMIYMSPEHLQGLRVTARSDIYALGTLLYEAVAGRPPCLLGMDEPTLESLSFAQLNRMPPPLDELKPDVPRFVARSLQRMLAKAPVDRFASMAEVGSVLRANAQRLLNEAPERATSHRPLWEATSRAPASSVMRSGYATTDVYELAPTSSPVVVYPAQRKPETAPLTNRPALAQREHLAEDLQETVRFRRSSVSQAASPTPMQFSLAPMVPAAPPVPRAALPPKSAAVARPLRQEQHPSEAANAAHAGVQSQAAEAPEPVRLQRLVVSAVCLGAAFGVALGLIQGPLRLTTSAEAAAVKPSGSVPVQPPSAAPSSLALVASAAPHAAVIPEQPQVSRLAPSAPVSAAPSPALANSQLSAPYAATRATARTAGPAKPLAPVSIARPAVAKSAASSSAKPETPVRHPKLIYGSDEVSE